ncbi:hypothetical protein AC578_2297 [Pseudocercospora eumusae]|uniref:Uncharacterized protein n=1 Tax=Pseudocercospora eumusae TaxID=321146 RepID=A0A139H105_9PEZI|nr:hypothetical protein AC578_2297 [Pseudocercospora eumusae]KXS96135.1 hypothetical protein AC578_2297 [Pseudocercospora eumusae]
MLGPCAVIPYDEQAYWIERYAGQNAYHKYSRQPIVKSPKTCASSKASIKTSTSSKKSSKSSRSIFSRLGLSRIFSRRSSYDIIDSE